MSEQFDIAEALGVGPAALPAIVTVQELVKAAPMPPPQVIEGVLHQGCKMILSGTSKSNKTWYLLNLAVSVASGTAWLGIGDTRHLWNLRGHNANIALLRPRLGEHLDRYQFGLIILDPVYRVLGDRDENANGGIAGLMNALERLAQRTRAAIVITHHFAKGDSTVKNAIDRMSGAGAWARDPDSLVVMTPHEALTVRGFSKDLSLLTGVLPKSSMCLKVGRAVLSAPYRPNRLGNTPSRRLLRRNEFSDGLRADRICMCRVSVKKIWLRSAAGQNTLAP
jgi:hypothetical protein